MAKKNSIVVWIIVAIVAGGGFLVLLLCVGGVALLLPAVQQAREAARRDQAQEELEQIGRRLQGQDSLEARKAARKRGFVNNLKQAALSAHNFHAKYGHLPPPPSEGYTSPNLTSRISFHTSLLPFLERGSLYRRIDKTVPWSAEVNRSAYQARIPTFLCPYPETERTTSGYAMAHWVPNARLVEESSGLSFSDIPDGMSNTILAGGVTEKSAPAWGDPNNGRDPANGFGGDGNSFGGFPGGAEMLCCDGSIHFISENIDPEVAKALGTPSGGETIRIPKSLPP